MLIVGPLRLLCTMNARTRYWRTFNALGRVVGLGFLAAGTVILIFGVAQRDWLIAIPGLVVATLGVFVSFARPYRPDTKG